jgi:hypothetical protein
MMAAPGTKRHGYTFFFEHQDCGVDCFHFGHGGLLKTWLNFSQDLCLLEAAQTIKFIPPKNK